MSNNKMKILGLSLGQLTTACLMVDGEVLACVSEERFTRNKNDMAYPKNSIEYCLKKAGIKGNDLDAVAIASLHIPADYQVIKKFSDFSIQDYVRAQRKIWHPKIYQNRNVSWLKVFKDKVNFKQYPGGWEQIDFTNDETMWKSYKPFIHNTISSHIGVDKSKIVHIEHHTAHAFYAYFGSPFRNGDCLIFTADAYGDGLSATISTVKDGRIERILGSSTFNLGRLYRYITLLLGMKPNEHEYKVMGLAPYAKEYHFKRPYEVFRETLYVEGIEFNYRQKPKDLYFYFKDKLEDCRFDGIAAGLQKYLEEILTQWVKNAAEQTKIGRAVFTGGVGMNVKAMKEIAKLPEIEDLFVCPSAGDESLAIGVCYKVMYDYCKKTGRNGNIIKSLKTVYLGPEFSDGYIENMIKENNLEKKYKIKKEVSAKEIAKEIAGGKIIGRCSGRMEFGARALGNRSILANPKFPNIVKKLNEKIKKRDFWMPFTPSILFERVKDYLVNPKNLSAPFMTIAFETTAKARQDLPGALHPADWTARPQFIKKDDNPEYYQLIKEFKKITGIGAILNTSFNLHGYPIILSPEDAMHVFENSDIDGVLLNKTLISKGKK